MKTLCSILGSDTPDASSSVLVRMLVAGHLTSEHANFKHKLCARNVFPAEMFQVKQQLGRVLPPRRYYSGTLVENGAPPLF